MIEQRSVAIPKLREVFGDHTFFVDDDGLHIIEPAATNRIRRPDPAASNGPLDAVKVELAKALNGPLWEGGDDGHRGPFRRFAVSDGSGSARRRVGEPCARTRPSGGHPPGPACSPTTGATRPIASRRQGKEQ